MKNNQKSISDFCIFNVFNCLQLGGKGGDGGGDGDGDGGGDGDGDVMLMMVEREQNFISHTFRCRRRYCHE